MKWLLAAILFFPTICLAQPRNPNPTTPDEVWQNDRDLQGDIKRKTDFLTENTSGQLLIAQGNGITPIWVSTGAASLIPSFLTSNTSGQILFGQGNGITPVWGSWAVYQIVSSSTLRQTATTSNSFQSTLSSIDIIVSSNTSRVLIWASGTLRSSDANGDSCYVTFLRNGSNIGGSTGLAELATNSLDSSLITPLSMVFIDSPATASQVTYNVGIRNSASVITCTYGVLSNQYTTIVAAEIKSRLGPP